ncbi:MAG: uracil-DNA glycosylase [Bacteroidetes bacterium]|nr:uracil-DNA glycosylase [Bacteroidota bacterium]MBL6962349.1 uracil-DNA glycosylase [Bacteroidota bacterium]
MTDLFSYNNEKNFRLVLCSEWVNLLKSEIEADYFNQILDFLNEEEESGRTVYPPTHEIFNALNLTLLEQIKVVILGQDPYHGAGQAHGLCFSVKKGIPAPPSLINIFKEIKNNTGIDLPGHGDLSNWAQQGVLLLNSILTVRAANAGSHQKIGWQLFTDAIIRTISDRTEGIVFLLWGKFACSKSEMIDASKHYILTAAHPSPFSANNGFFGCEHFSKTNEILKSIGREPIDWRI